MQVGYSPVGTRPSAPCFQNQAGLGSDRDRACRLLFLQRDNGIMDEACTGIQMSVPRRRGHGVQTNTKACFRSKASEAERTDNG